MLSFYKGITMGKYYGSPNTMGPQTIGQQTSQIFISGASPPYPPAEGNGHPCTPHMERLYSKTGVQTQLSNNISESERSGSTTNIFLA